MSLRLKFWPAGGQDKTILSVILASPSLIEDKKPSIKGKRQKTKTIMRPFKSERKGHKALLLLGLSGYNGRILTKGGIAMNDRDIIDALYLTVGALLDAHDRDNQESLDELARAISREIKATLKELREEERQPRLVKKCEEVAKS